MFPGSAAVRVPAIRIGYRADRLLLRVQATGPARCLVISSSSLLSHMLPKVSSKYNVYHFSTRPRSPLAQAAWDYKEELKRRQDEDGNITTESAFEILANHRIREAMDNGDFTNIEGTGKPRRSRAETDPAIKVMKNAGIVPSWIEAGREARKLLAKLSARTTLSCTSTVEDPAVSALSSPKPRRLSMRWSPAPAAMAADGCCG